MKTEFTKIELYNEVQKTYNGVLTPQKAIALFNIEYGFTPTIIEDEHKFSIPEATLNQLSTKYGVTFTSEHFEFMKELQESGVCNMIVGDVRQRIQNYFLEDMETVAAIHKAYMSDYEALYFPENLV